MKKIYLFSTGILSLAAVGLMVAPGFANAQGGTGNGNGSQQAITYKAQALGMTESQLRTQLESKTMLQIAADKGISQAQWQEQMENAAQELWKANGLSQEQIDSRTQAMEQRQADCDGTGSGSGGMHQNRVNQ